MFLVGIRNGKCMNTSVSNEILYRYILTNWDRITHECVSKLRITDSHNGLSPGRCQANIWSNGVILPITPLGTNVYENLIESHTFSFKKMHLKSRLENGGHFVLRDVVVYIWVEITWLSASVPASCLDPGQFIILAKGYIWRRKYGIGANMSTIKSWKFHSSITSL